MIGRIFITISTTNGIIVLWYWHHYQIGNVAFRNLELATKKNNFGGKCWNEAALQSNIFWLQLDVMCASFGLLTFDTQLHLQKAIRPFKSWPLHFSTKVHRDLCKNVFSNSASHKLHLKESWVRSWKLFNMGWKNSPWSSHLFEDWVWLKTICH